MTAAPALPNGSDAAWLLAMLDDWLLVAEPATVRELAAFLRSIGSQASATDVIRRLHEVRCSWTNATTESEDVV